jgi:hypothetical protein
MNTRTVLWIDEVPIATIEDSQERMIFALRDNYGTHLTIWRHDGVFRSECSSARPLGSVWDEARRGIARDGDGLKYLNWQKHANYLMNRALDHYADSSLPLVTFSMPQGLKPARPALKSKPAIRLSAPDTHFDLSLYFSPLRFALPELACFEGQIGRLMIGLTKQ